MIRVKDAERSLGFYRDVLGMEVRRVVENAGSGFNLYFLGYGPPAPDRAADGVSPVAGREGLLELTWNYGTEKDPDFRYHDGNTDPKGYGHICISVDDLDAACDRLDEKKVSWQKKLQDGKLKDVAFILGRWSAVEMSESANERCRPGWILD